MKITILGAGGWGSTLATLLAENNSDKEVLIWAREQETVDSINNDHENKTYLEGIKLSPHLKATTDIVAAATNADIILSAIPSQFLRENIRPLKDVVKEGVIVVNVAKGLELKTFKRMSEVIIEELPHAHVAVLSGPNHAEEVSQKIPTATVIASSQFDTTEIISYFESSYFKVYPHDDAIGLEVCGFMKNITAIATGVVNALGLGDNATGAIITLGLREMVKLGKHFGAKPETFYGVAGVGDLVATCTSPKSRNRRVGGYIVKGLDSEQIKTEMHGMVAEGVMSCKAVHEYAAANDLSLPLTEQVYKVLFEKKELKHAINDLKNLI